MFSNRPEATSNILATARLRVSEGARPYIRGFLQFARDQPLGVVSALLTLLILTAAFLAPILAPFDPVEPDYDTPFAPPGLPHIMGTDNFGRDVFSRVLWGARITLAIAFVATLVGVTTGAIWGLVSGYVGDKLDIISQRLIDTLMAFPVLILTLTVVATLGLSTNSVIAAISVALIPQGTRPVRSVVMSLRQREFVEAVRAIGAGDVRIIFYHILPNCVAPYIVVLTVFLSWAIVVEASLSFLGFGPPPPTPSWGRMLSAEGRRYLQEAPWIAIFPGLAISFAVFGFNMLGDAVRDALDPHLRRGKR